MDNVALDNNGLAITSGSRVVYNYDASTGEYLDSNEEYLQQGVGLPANSCAVAPPSVEAGSTALYQNGRWQIVADHRGETVYSIKDGTAVEITAPGDYPADTTLLKPSTPYDVWNGKAWITDVQAQHAAQNKAAEQERQSLLSAAQSSISIWQSKLLLGRISDSEKARLNSWLDYIDALQAIDISVAPNITWPYVPSV
ncbi:tail fiber assembly protein [Cronobacter sakazakii]|uniref:Tail fiber assembly protein n=1 Tax=Cronobacter sakazakii TaxID=28141 RepID=A0AA45C1I8_CROSK|nr:tail fiber assembly protein [Cronobacter sakazakii]EIV2971409.1 tail fiber assembly protein [Cronobacter sakazakii]EIZ8956990.1 tail fiber assembly protein [Cronobacter sakazakii]EJQ2005482.1 tail fiber assembly protein [Cronobacter sakazakii]EJQ2086596.1 tail fiber assembly protein [Cronobacter sakazakii]EJR9310270.1 tail fiber assembly protein [Cronobacter sakazakii]